MDLPGDWEVALIDLSYPHNWINLDREYIVAFLTDPPPNLDTVKTVDTVPNNEKDLVSVLTSDTVLPTMSVLNIFRIPAGNYSLKDLTDFIQLKISIFVGFNDVDVKFNDNTQKVSFVTDRKFALACYANHSALQLVGLSKQTSTINNAGKPLGEYISFEPMRAVVS